MKKENGQADPRATVSIRRRIKDILKMQAAARGITLAQLIEERLTAVGGKNE